MLFHFVVSLIIHYPIAANHCPLWANYVLHHPYPHCYANL